MEIKVDKDKFYKAISRVQSIIEKRSNMPILSMILLSTTDSSINISATDLETGFEGLYPAKIKSHGAIVINSRKFYEIVKEFPSNEIEVKEVENHWIKIGNKKVTYNIVGMNPDDFPERPSIEDVKSHFLQIFNCEAKTTFTQIEKIHT